jgi:poly-gamma-glutamate synthesis protein (capsule biosynthesis protein)
VADVPIVPVVQFRSAATRSGWSDVRGTLAGRGPYSALEIVAADADGILAAIGSSRSAAGPRLVLAPSAAALARDLAAHRDRLGFLRASAVGPSVRALAWGASELFGVHRATSSAGWPLTASLTADARPFDPSRLWTVWAGGDLGVDRRVALVVTQQKKGVHYPYDGGTAKIAGSTCCSSFGWTLPIVVRTGGAASPTGTGGAVRDLISSADLAVANMEEPAPDHFTFHEHGTVFTGDPRLIEGIARAGIDVVSMASNHVGDGGRAGVLQTKANLLRYGVRSFGAGANLAAARRPFVTTVDGVRVAILGYDAIPPTAYWATPTTAGSAPLMASYVKSDIAAARVAGAQVVIVYPHWGVEYTTGPSSAQRSMAHLMIDSGADIVVGNHPHWAGAMEVYRGKPIWYALGNFTFDQTWSEPTLEGISLELTFDGPTLVQARMHPHVLVGGVQPNLLDPAGSGRRVLDPIFAASTRLLPW